MKYLRRKLSANHLMSMLKKEIQRGVLILTPQTARIDTITSPLLRKLVQEELENEQIHRLILNLENVDFIDSAGLVSFLSIWKQVKKLNGDYKIANPKPHVKQIIELVLLNRIFALYSSVDEALLSFEQEPLPPT